MSVIIEEYLENITVSVEEITEDITVQVIIPTDTVYTHPTNHPPSIISQDSSNRFVTDAEKETWNGKQANLGFTLANATVQGNTFNGNNELVKTNLAGVISIDLIDPAELKRFEPNPIGLQVEEIITLSSLNTGNVEKRIIEITSGVDKGIYFHTGSLLKKLTTTDVSLPSPVILLDANTLGWYSSDDPTTITKDGSGLVSAWGDKNGSVRDFITDANSLAMPLWSTNGVLFDGVWNFMHFNAISIKPIFIYAVVKVLSGTGNYDTIFSGKNGSFKVSAYDIATTPKLLTESTGGVSLINTAIPLDSFMIVRILADGASSKTIINDLTPVTGTINATDIGGFILGSSADTIYGGNNANIEVKELVIRSASDSFSDETSIYNYLKQKYSL